MKLLVRSLVVIIISLATICAVIYYNPNIAGNILKSLVERSLSNGIMNLEIGGVESSINSMIFKNISLKSENTKIANIENVKISYDLKKIFKDRGLHCNIQIANFVMDEIKFNATGDIEYGFLHKKIVNMKVDFVGGGFIVLNSDYTTASGKPSNLMMNGTVTDLPLMLHKAFWSMAPNNGIVSFLKDYISKGFVSGNWSINLDKEFFKIGNLKPENIMGKFALRDVALRYDVEYPMLQHLNANVEMLGTQLEFKITHGYSGNVALYDGRVELDWEKGENSEVIIQAFGKGPVLDIVEFIPRDTVEDLKKHSFDLRTMSGQVMLDFNMKIPLLPGTENIYDVKADISNMAMKAFDNKLELSQGNFKGVFDGKRIGINGKGKVNGFDSDVNYSIILGENKEVENILGIKLKFTPTENMKNSSFSIVNGKSIFDIIFKSKGDSASFSANADLKDLEFFIEKVGLHKAQGSKAYLQIMSTGNDKMPNGLKVKVTGDDNLLILGDMKFGDKNQVFNISKLQHLNTDIQAQITLGADSLKAIISGNKLDLSQANMMNFLAKDAKARDTDLQVNIAKIKMKNNIWISDFVMSIRCDKIKCFAGEMDSRIGTQSFRMRLSPQDNTERWEISSTNAGALFKALDMYDSIKAGSIMLTVNTSRKDAKVGEPIPVVKGQFVLKKFVTTDTPILTRMVSFISFSGMKSLISGNKNISFSEMVGDFSYKGDLIKIKRGAAQGPFFDFTISGLIDTKQHAIKLKGSVTPSLYGISAIVKKIPLIGGILGGSGHRKGLISPPYSINSKY